MNQDSSLTQSRFSRFRSATGSALTTGILSRKRMWVGPALTAVVIAAVGWMTHRSVEGRVFGIRQQTTGRVEKHHLATRCGRSFEKLAQPLVQSIDFFNTPDRYTNRILADLGQASLYSFKSYLTALSQS